MGQSVVPYRAVGKEHPLVSVLVADGFTYRRAHQIVNCIFDSIKEALQRHEEVETPLGTFKVVPNVVKPYRRWRWGKPVTFYKKRYRVVFIPREEG